MDSSRIIQKMIEGSSYFYDRWLDVIFQSRMLPLAQLDRTQVDKAVDLCVEITTWCNFTCRNCFSGSERSRPGAHLEMQEILSVIDRNKNDLIRVSITGGEPMMHPEIELILNAPRVIDNCGFVLSTNGTMRSDLDDLLVRNGWLVAISLHGNGDAHNKYTRSKSFDKVVRRIEKLADKTIVHIYTVLHDGLTDSDARWILRFRDEVGAKFVRFITPRDFGRFQPLVNTELISKVQMILDQRSGLKSGPSQTKFLSVHGQSRFTK